MIEYIVFGIIIFLLILGFHEKRTNKFCRSRKRLDGKTVIVTGGTLGMGLEISTDLAERGARVIAACPFADEGARGIRTIVERSGSENVVFKLLDLQSIESVRKFAKEILATEERLDILINNAGVGDSYQYLTKNGMNSMMAINYYGTFLLTLLLLPLLQRTGTPGEPARIVNTTSLLHYIGVVDFDKMNRVNHYMTIRVYANSKLCLLLFARELSRKLHGERVVINSAEPGAVGTTIFVGYMGKIGLVLTMFFKHFFKTPWEGAQTALHIALDNHAAAESGELFRNCTVVKAKTIAYDEKVAARLWEESIRLVQLEQDEVKDLLYSGSQVSSQQSTS